MTDHLRPEEFIDALDGVPSSVRAAHLHECAACRAELDSLSAMQAAARDDNAPEPSPLFWDHLSERVRQATATEDLAPQPWWRIGWRPIAAFAAAAAIVVMAWQGRPSNGVAISTLPVEPTSASVEQAFVDDGSWEIVMELASEASWEDVHDAVMPAPGAADAAIEELTAAQREALVRLLKQEIGE